MVPGNTLEITVVCASDDAILGRWTNKLYALPTPFPTNQTQLDSLCDFLSTAIAAKYKPALVETHKYVGLLMKWRDDGDVELESYSTAGAGNGALDGEAMGDDVVMEIQRRTNRIGRQHRGRIFLSGVAESGCENGVIQDGTDLKTALGLLAAFLSTDVAVSEDIGIAWRHWNRKDNAVEVVTAMRPSVHLASRMDRRAPLKPNEGVY